MSSPPMKSLKGGNKKKEYSCNHLYRLCGVESGAIAESIILSKFSFCTPGSVSADCCFSIGFALIQCKMCLNIFLEVVASGNERCRIVLCC